MTPEVLSGLVALVFVALLLCGMPVPFAIAVPAVFYLVAQGGTRALDGLGLVSWGSIDTFTLTAVPMFILMAEILMRSGVSDRVYSALSRLLTRIPGGLLQTNILGSAIMAATIGSSVATAAAMGSVALPQLEERNYDPRLSTGSLAAGGTLGILIPPSVAMIIYGSITETSVAKLFMAGVLPGILLTLMFMAYIAFRGGNEQGRGGAVRLSLIEGFRTVLELTPFLVLIAMTMGTMYFGYITPTEAGAIGCALALIISLIWGDLSWAGMHLALRSSLMTIGRILFIVFAAYLLSYSISMGGAGDRVTGFLVGLHLGKGGFIAALFVLYIVLGALVETMAMIVLTVPLLFPVVTAYGLDPIWFGVMLVVFVEIGQITPPIGINLFMIQSLSNRPLKDIIIGALPFFAIMVVLLVGLAVWPELALWIPAHMASGPSSHS